jgi:hypothetical protein
MRSIFAGLAMTMVLSLAACGQKPTVGGEAGKECKDLIEKFDGWCKDAKDPIKGFCESNKAAIDTLKKVPVEATCQTITGAYKQIKDAAGAVPTGEPAGSQPAGDAAGSQPAGDAAGSQPTGDGK